jgi:hypothetical protein
MLASVHVAKPLGNGAHYMATGYGKLTENAKFCVDYMTPSRMREELTLWR